MNFEWLWLWRAPFGNDEGQQRKDSNAKGQVVQSLGVTTVMRKGI